MPGDTTPGDVVLASGPLVVIGPGVTELGSSGYPGSPPPPVSRGQQENSAELACSRVVAADMLLWEEMAMVGRDILHLIWVS
jgi:hypothetical protein